MKTSVAEGSPKRQNSCGPSTAIDTSPPARIAVPTPPRPERVFAIDQPNGTNSRKLATTSLGESSKPWNGTHVTRSHCGRCTIPNHGPLAIAITTIQNGHERLPTFTSSASNRQLIHHLGHAFRFARQLNCAIVLGRRTHRSADGDDMPRR